MGSKMKSNADIIYNHIEKQKGDFVVPIEVNNDRNLQHILTQYVCKHNIFKKVIEEEERRKRAEFNSNILMPYFLTELVKWENKVGVKSEFWSEQEHEKFKYYFMSKYKDMIK